MFTISLVAISFFWVSNASAQSCQESSVFLAGAGDILWCNEPNPGAYTYTVTDSSPPYSMADPLRVTFTGGKSNSREPFYPSYETASGTCEPDKYASTITITFNKKVSNVRTFVAHYMDQAIDYTVSANNGSTSIVSLGAFQWNNNQQAIREVIVPGNDITSVTIRPNSFGPDGTWHFMVWHHVYYTQPVDYISCNCNRSTMTGPTSALANGFGWNMGVSVSQNEGLVLQNVSLNGRFMAEKISVPYFTLQTPTGNVRGRLKPDSTDTSLRSRLVNYYTMTDDHKMVVEATYVIDQIPGFAQSCLHITQRYEFYKEGVLPCEPSGTISCSNFKPTVKYKFFGPVPGALTIAQRSHITVKNFSRNTVGLFRDCDTLLNCLSTLGYMFKDKQNPLWSETKARVITNGQSEHSWDNVHLTYQGIVEEPPALNRLVLGGCPECFHSHWRWGTLTPFNLDKFNNGRVIIPPGSTQDLEFAIVRNRASEEQVDFSILANDVNSLVNGELIRHSGTGNELRDPQAFGYSLPEDVVLWYVPTGHQAEDTFLSHGVFFAPSSAADVDMTPAFDSGSPGNSQRSDTSSKSSNSSATTAVTTGDGPINVRVGTLYQSGSITYTNLDPTLVGPLPTGYTVYNTGYELQTDAPMAGPHIVTFNMSSVTDQSVFDNLRIFHAEVDPADPSKSVWVDRTILAGDIPPPDFYNKNISARVSLLGPFVIGTLAQPQPPDTSIADLGVTLTDSPDPVVAGNNVTYTVTVTNNGPQTANDVVLTNGMSPYVDLVSLSTTKGTCIESQGNVNCKLNPLPVGSNAIVSIVARPAEAQLRSASSPISLFQMAMVRAKETDNQLTNNTVTQTTTVSASSNPAPSIGITSPSSGALFVGPASINLVANASDSNGSISQVEFFDNATSIGSGTSIGTNQYTRQWTNVSFGNHSLTAVATDNAGKKTISPLVDIIVNGTAAVAIVSPAADRFFSRPTDVAVAATATDSTAGVSKVGLFASGILIGEGSPTPEGQYIATWMNPPAGKYRLTAVATDNSGVTTISSGVNITINDVPSVSITTPATNSIFNAQSGVTIRAVANDRDSIIQSADLYADGQRLSNFLVSQYGIVSGLIWNNPPVGNHILTVVVRDNQGGVSTSAPVLITINALPTVSITAPAGGTVFNAPASTTLNASVGDSDGTVAGVNFYANGVLIGPGALVGSNLYSINWTQSTPNTYSLTAVATDDRGGTRTSSAVSVIINGPPTVSMTSPANNAGFAAPANITLTASASDQGGSINTVTFAVNGSSIGAGSSLGNGQYSINWANVAVGSYTVTAVATDNLGTTTTSSPINVIVSTAPSVTLSSPATGTTFSPLATISLTANAFDSDGSITNVDFYANQIMIGTGTSTGTGSYSFTWTNVSRGLYTLTALATDNTGVQSLSQGVLIKVLSPALFVTGSTTLSSSDNAVKTRLEALGFTVTVKDASAATSADANGKAVVVISSTVSPTNLGTKFRSVATPVVTWESGSYVDMGMTAKGNSNAGTSTGQTQVAITQPSKPLAGGLFGTPIVVTASSTFAWGKPNANATSVAVLMSDTTRIVVFGYTAGAIMPGLTAPARRVGLFMNDTTPVSLNNNGWALFDAALNWTTSTTP